MKLLILLATAHTVITAPVRWGPIIGGTTAAIIGAGAVGVGIAAAKLSNMPRAPPENIQVSPPPFQNPPIEQQQQLAPIATTQPPVVIPN